MGKTRHYRPEERSIHRAKVVTDKATKYKTPVITQFDDDDLDEEEQAYYAELNAPDYTEF